ncbi:MAG TPA: hypothetical protein PK435_13760 [Thermoanaerobaculaceae bacterium]|nr:hypothetical protein [Thermoanaerobaculaceae bacterium]
MRRVTALAAAAILVGGWAVAQSHESVLEVFKTQRDIEKRLMAADLATLERVQDQIRGACDRLVRLGDDLLRAQKDGEDLGGFTARSSDLRHAESEVTTLLGAASQLRATIGARRAYLEQVQAEIRRIEEAAQAVGDELSGRWSVAIEPGGLAGVFDLRLDGTLVTGVYQISGGWKGSLRGTLVGGDVRLERIDTQQGFVAVYTGRLVARGNEKQLEGTWEATNLAVGMPGSGTWVARREAHP